jgi:hypothetical protein
MEPALQLELKEWDRRRIVTGIGIAVLTVQCASSCTQSSGPPEAVTAAGNNLLIHSSPGFAGHTHDLWIPYSVLDDPPADGVKLESTTGLFHTHSIALTKEQLMDVRRGGTARVPASSHVFLIALTTR